MEHFTKVTFIRGLSLKEVLEFVHVSNASKSDIYFIKNEKTVNGKGVLGMVPLMLTIREGDTIAMVVEGIDADVVLGRLLDIISSTQKTAI